MRIAILAAGFSPLPPIAQGGTEWIAYYQAKGLAEKGHEVMLIAAKGTAENFKDTSVRVLEIGEGAVEDKSGLVVDPKTMEGSRILRRETICLAQTIQVLIDQKDSYDIILNNMRGEAIFLPIAKMLQKPFVNVLHLNVFAELAAIFSFYKTCLIPISDSQKKAFPDLNFLPTVYNGVDVEKFVFSETQGEYLLMVGTIGRHKNQQDAITVAKMLGMKLILAGKVRDKDYFEELKKDIDGDQIRWVGEVDFREKVDLYQHAKAFLFTIQWEEPFGLVMIEAMACGTPVIAYNRGSVPEIIKDGVTGFIIDPDDEDRPGKGGWVIKQKGIAGLTEAIKRIGEIDRKACREHVEKNFTVEQMVDEYERVYKKLL